MTEIDQNQLGELLSSYLDGELDEQQAQRVEQMLKENESARRLLNELQQTSQLISTLPRQQAPASIFEEFQNHLERDELLGEPITPPVNSRRQRRPLRAILSAAAAIAVIVTGGMWMTRENGNSSRIPSRDTVVDANSNIHKPSPTPTEEKEINAREARIGSSDAGETSPTNLDTRLETGTNVQEIQSYAFAGETLRLKIKAHDAADRDRLSTRLVKHLSKRNVQNLAKTPGHTSINSRSGSFFYQGSPAVNFTDKTQAQMIVRVPVEEMDQLLDELSQEKNIDDRVVLSAGPMTVQGIAQTRSSLLRQENVGLLPAHKQNDTGLREGEQPTRFQRKKSLPSKDNSYRKKNKSADDEILVHDLSNILDMDPESVAAMWEESRADATDAPSISEATTTEGSTTNQTGVNQPMKIESYASKSNENRPKELENEQQQYITFIVELDIDQSDIKSPANSNQPKPANTIDKSKPTSKPSSKSGAQ